MGTTIWGLGSCRREASQHRVASVVPQESFKGNCKGPSALSHLHCFEMLSSKQHSS